MVLDWGMNAQEEPTDSSPSDGFALGEHGLSVTAVFLQKT